MPTHYEKKFIVLHHTLTPRDFTSFEAVNNYHKNKWDLKSSLGFYIGYHYFIDGQGKIWQGRADWEEGAHCKERGRNRDSIGVCLAGNFDQEMPSAQQLTALKKILKQLMVRHGLPEARLKFHRDYAPHKSCPGKSIKKGFVSGLLAG